MFTKYFFFENHFDLDLLSFDLFFFECDIPLKATKNLSLPPRRHTHTHPFFLSSTMPGILLGKVVPIAGTIISFFMYLAPSKAVMTARRRGALGVRLSFFVCLLGLSFLLFFFFFLAACPSYQRCTPAKRRGEQRARARRARESRFLSRESRRTNAPLRPRCAPDIQKLLGLLRSRRRSRFLALENVTNAVGITSTCELARKGTEETFCRAGERPRARSISSSLFLLR